MKIGNIGFVVLTRTRAQLIARPQWLAPDSPGSELSRTEHPVDHASPSELAKVIPFRPRSSPQGITRRAAGSD